MFFSEKYVRVSLLAKPRISPSLNCRLCRETSIESLEGRHLLAADFVSEFALERGDINQDGERSPSDLEVLSQGIGGEFQSALDANRDGMLDASDRSFWIESLARTYVGDSNFDGQFGSADTVAVFIAGQ